LQLDFRLFCSLSWSAFSALPAFILFFIYIFFGKKRILGNHPKLGDDSCDIAVAQINYPSFKHNTQDSIKQARGQSHEEDSSQIFMLDDMQFRGVWTLFRLKQKKIENYQTKFNKIRKLSREQTLVASTHPPTEIRTDHGNETSIYILNIYLFLALVS
jgi:hypothetical protein